MKSSSWMFPDNFSNILRVLLFKIYTEEFLLLIWYNEHICSSYCSFTIKPIFITSSFFYGLFNCCSSRKEYSKNHFHVPLKQVELSKTVPHRATSFANPLQFCGNHGHARQMFFQHDFTPWWKICRIENSLKNLLDPANNFCQGF